MNTSYIVSVRLSNGLWSDLRTYTVGQTADAYDQARAECALKQAMGYRTRIVEVRWHPSY